MVADEYYMARAVQLAQRRLVHEQIQLTGAAGHEQEDHRLGPRRMMGPLHPISLNISTHALTGKQLAQRHRSHADAALLEEMTASESLQMI